MSKLYKVNVLNKGEAFAGVACVNPKRLLAIFPHEKQHRAIFNVPVAGKLMHIDIISSSIPNDLFDDDSLIRFKAADENGLPLVGPAAFNPDVVLYGIFQKFAGGPVMVLFTAFGIQIPVVASSMNDIMQNIFTTGKIIADA